MRKQERRAWICLMLAMVLVAGIGVFGYRLVKNGGKWASFYGNTQIYTDGYINRGTVKDRNGEELLTATPEGVFYSPDRVTRLATVHAVGDPAGNIPAGAINMFRSQLIGYDLMNGTSKYLGIEYLPQDLEAFKAYTEHKLSKLERRLDRDALRDIFWHIYGNPVENH